MLYLLILAFLLAPLAATEAAVPICVVCTVAVGAGVGLTRWLGVDDTIAGLWIGGLASSLSLWVINWLNNKKIKFFGRQPIIFAAFYASIIWPLYYYGIAGHPLNKLWGIDKLTLGMFFGTAGLIAGVLFNEYLKKKNNNKAYFPFQKAVVPVSVLAVLSLVFYLINLY